MRHDDVVRWQPPRHGDGDDGECVDALTEGSPGWWAMGEGTQRLGVRAAGVQEYVHE